MSYDNLNPELERARMLAMARHAAKEEVGGLVGGVILVFVLIGAILFGSVVGTIGAQVVANAMGWTTTEGTK